MKATIASISILVIYCASFDKYDPEEGKANVEKVYLEPAKDESKLSPLKSAQNCGGPSKFVEFRMTGCTETSNICEIPVSAEELQAEIDFIPDRDMKQLNMYAACSCEDTFILVFDGPIGNSAVEKGVKYTVTIVGTLAEEHRGKSLNCGFEIMEDGADNSVRVCVETEGNIV